MDTHRIQDMHLFLAETLRLSAEMALAVPLQEITLHRICVAVDPKAIDKMISVHSTPSPLCPVGRKVGVVLNRTYDTLKEEMISGMKSITMKKIVNDYHMILEMGI